MSFRKLIPPFPSPKLYLFMIFYPVGTSAVAATLNLVPRALFPGFGDGAGKGPGIGWPIRHFNWLIDLGNSGK